MLTLGIPPNPWWPKAVRILFFHLHAWFLTFRLQSIPRYESVISGLFWCYLHLNAQCKISSLSLILVHWSLCSLILVNGYIVNTCSQTHLCKNCWPSGWAGLDCNFDLLDSCVEFHLLILNLGALPLNRLEILDFGSAVVFDSFLEQWTRIPPALMTALKTSRYITIVAAISNHPHALQSNMNVSMTARSFGFPWK